MNLYLDPPGFLGTGASLLADLTLVAYVLLIVPAMLIGFYFARHGKHRPHHQVLMNGVTVVNWVLIIFLMITAYRFDVIDNIVQQPGNLRYFLPTIHGLLGLSAQILATYIMVRMALEDRAVVAAKRRGERSLSQYWWKPAKPVMQTTLALWLATSLLGVGNYVVRYEIIPSGILGSGAAPEATEPALSVESTPEVDINATEEPLVATDEVIAPAVTEDAIAPIVTPEVTMRTTTRRPVVTPEITAEPTVRRPVATAEVRDDDDDNESDDDHSGSRSSNSGSGSNNSGSGSGGSGSGNSGSGSGHGGSDDDGDDGG